METKYYCYNCDKEVNVKIEEKEVDMEVKGTKFVFLGEIAYCSECNEEIYISKINDENIKKANEKYREQINLIKVSEIEELLRKYNIGKEPLAILLGWGEKTILRYCIGLMPLKEYSDRLRELYNPFKMKELYNKNGYKITGVAQKKLEKSINEACFYISENLNPTQVANVSNYFLSNIDVEAEETITPLKLQKLVYYAQAWALAFLQKTLFLEDFQAWVHGPVIPSLYFSYKELGFNPIPKVEFFDENVFSSEEKEVLNMVRKVYGKYDPKFLERLTHCEEPWKIARGNCNKHERSINTIEKDDIKKYYTSIKESLASIDRVEEYVNSININY